MNVTRYQPHDLGALDFDTSALPDAYDTLELGNHTLDVRGVERLGNGSLGEDPTMRMVDAWLRATEPSRLS